MNAKVPAGATKEQFQLMLQSLRAERFQMVTHRETKESQVFELVQAKGGHKLKEYVEEPASPGGDAANREKKSVRPAPGNMVIRSVVRGVNQRGGNQHMDSTGMPVEGIVRMLSNYLGKPVVNTTGLTGKYNVKMHFSAEGLPGGSVHAQTPRADSGSGMDAAPDLFKEQLGLKLEQKKGMIEVIVVDKALKTPTAN